MKRNDKTSGAIGRGIRELFQETVANGVMDAAAPLPFFTPLPGVLAQAAKESPAPALRRGRRKIWQLEDKLHCPVVGTCLPMDELEVLSRRYDFMSTRANEFSLHVEAVNKSRDRTPFAEALQKYLDRRYQSAIKIFENAASAGELAALWREHLARGEVPGPFWALVTHPAADGDLWSQAYGDVHMLSHQVGAGVSADVRRLETLEQDNADLRARLDELRRDQAQRELQWQERLRSREAELAPGKMRDKEIEVLRERLAQYESGSAMVDMGRRLMDLSDANEHLLLLAERARQQESLLRRFKEEAEALREERDSLAAEREALESLLMAEDGGEGCGEDCANCDGPGIKLRGRRVLCVGGRSQLLIHYRRLAEKLGIKLIHHDGGMEESLSRLPDMISGADAVICPTDCVSHPAYYRIKSQCKRLGKPCLLFKGAGVSSFAAALMRFQPVAIREIQ